MADVANLIIRVNAKEVEDTKKKLGEMGVQAEQTEQKVNRLGMAMKAGAVLAAGYITRQIIQNTINQQNAIAQLEARLVSTAGAAGRSSQQLQEMASALQKVSTFGDDAVMSAQALLLTFKQIRGEEFDRATKATLDLATAMGGDLKGAALQLGKALEDPVTGLTALRRSGVSFTEAQQDQIKAMVEAGKVAQAQNLILAEMETQFGGAAAAARNTFGGALAHLKNVWGDLFEASQGSSQGMIDAINAVAAALPKLRQAFDNVIKGVQLLAIEAAVLWERLTRGRDAAQRMREAATEQAIALFRASEGTTNYAAAVTLAANAVDRLAGAQRRQVRVTIGDPSAVLLPGGPSDASLSGRGFQTSGLPTPSVLNPDEIARRNRRAARETTDEWLEAFSIISSAVAGYGNAIVSAINDVIFQVRLLRREADETSNAIKYTQIAATGFGVGQAVGGMTDSRLRGGVGGGVAGATSGFMMGGPVGAVIGGVTGFIGGLLSAGKKAREAAKQAEEAARLEALAAEQRARQLEAVRRSVDLDIESRERLLAATNEYERAMAAARNRYEQELERIRQLMISGNITPEQFERLVALVGGEYAQAIAEINNAIARDAVEAFNKAAEAARQFNLAVMNLFGDLVERGLRATGQGGAADIFGMGTRHRREMAGAREAGMSPEMLALMAVVQDAERRQLALQQAIGGIKDGLELQLAALKDQATVARETWQVQDKAYADQIDALQDAAQATDKGFAESIKIAKDQLRTVQDQLRTQQRTVDELKRVVENLAEFRASLMVSNLTTLSPAQQLSFARAQFQELVGKALAGDLTAAQGLPGAGRTFLEASRGYSASNPAYAADFQAVQDVLARINVQYSGKLTVEERMLAELQAQSYALSTQIEQLETAREQSAAQFATQISDLQAQREVERNRYDAQIALIQAQMDAAEERAAAEIAFLQNQFDEEMKVLREQLAQLEEQVRLLNIVGTYITDQEGGGVLPPITFGPLLTQGEATITVLQTGFTDLKGEMEAVRTEVASLRTEMRHGLEVY